MLTWYKMSGSTKVPVPTTDDNYKVTHTVGDGAVYPLNYNSFSLDIQRMKSTDVGQYRCEGVSSGRTAFSDITLSGTTTAISH